MKKLAIFASGRGTNMDNIVRKIDDGTIKKCEVAVVFSDKAKALALIKAKKRGIETLHIAPSEFATKPAFEKKVVRELKKRDIDYIVLAGYMRILSPYIIKKYRNKIINIHPALLPAFRCAHGIKDAYNAGVKVTGVSVHFVTPELDSGPIIVQKAITVEEHESLESLERRIHDVEYELYPLAINLLIGKKLTIRRHKVSIKS